MAWRRLPAGRPQFVFADMQSCPQPPIRALVGMDWRFNGWGDLYGTFDNDKRVAAKVRPA
jgi:hypothetical protein